MRKVCPVCLSPSRLDPWQIPFIVPDGWPLPTLNTVCLCLNCGMIYYDNDKTDADYQEYYRKYYGFEGFADRDKHVPRWESDIQAVMMLEPNKDALIVDVGGGIGYIARRLREEGYHRAVSVEVGEPIPQGCDLIMSIHVIEHVYDIRTHVESLIAALKPEGRLFIEVPDASEYYKRCELPMVDYIQVHINHFTPGVLDHLFFDFGYEPIYRLAAPLPGWDSSMYRALYAGMANPEPAIETYSQSMWEVKHRTAERLAKLQAVTGEVIVWGAGPYCLHLLARAPEVAARVVEWVDNDPAYRGATILGKPVMDRPTREDLPILVICQQQATGVLGAIERAGCKNEVITI